MSAIDHLHFYQRIKTRPRYYRCTHPECTHIQFKEFLEGKKACCPFCGNEFTITIKMLNSLKTLHCDDCTRSRKKKLEKAPPEIKSEILQRIFKGAVEK